MSKARPLIRALVRWLPGASNPFAHATLLIGALLFCVYAPQGAHSLRGRMLSRTRVTPQGGAYNFRARTRALRCTVLLLAFALCFIALRLSAILLYFLRPTVWGVFVLFRRSSILISAVAIPFFVFFSFCSQT